MTIRLGALTALLVVAVAGNACSTSPSSSSFFNWSVDSRSYSAAQDGLTYSNNSQNTFSGFTCQSGQSVSFATVGGGKFKTGSFTADAFTLFINEGLAATAGGPGPFWTSSTGNLTLTAVDGDHIAGSFDITLVPSTNSTETGTAHATGTFSVPPFVSAGSLCGNEASGS